MFRPKNEFRSKEFRSNEFRSKNEFRSLVDLSSKLNKLSHNCLLQELCLCVCGLGRLSCAVKYTCHMPGRTTRKCKETLLQVRERLQREQANRTSKRIRELLGSGHSDSESDSEEEHISSIDTSSDTLPLIRRDLYLGLLCLLLFIVLQNYWVSSTFLRK
jgi:hypothetical protein